MPGRPRGFALAAALDQAIAVSSERGYSGTSIADLGKAMGLLAGSLCQAFADKQAIFVAALARYVALRGEQLSHLPGPAQTGREGLRQVLLWHAASSTGLAGQRGCLLVHSALELSTAEPGVAHRIRQVLAANEARLLTLLQQGQADGSVLTALDAVATARLLCLLQGMRVVGKTGRPQSEMTDLVGQAGRLLD